jgi:predicted amidohydrolase
MAGMVGADFRRGLAALLDVAAQDVWAAYEEVFGGLAREFGVTVVAPSAYLPDPLDGVIRNIAVVFDSNGQMAGRQAKVVLHPADADMAQAGSTWDVIATDAGQIGLILGSDVMYPEVGRLLAYQGAEMLVVQAASTDQVLYQKIRAGALARMQDNQLFAAVSFLVGDNRLSRSQRTPYTGKSAIFAPQELTPRSNGVLVEMGNLRSEGVLAAEWDFAALRELWENSETPVRRQLPLQQAGQVLAQLYARLQVLPKVAQLEQLTGESGEDDESARGGVDELAPAQSLDDLVVIATVTQRWPLQLETSEGGTATNGYSDLINDEGDFVIVPADLNGNEDGRLAVIEALHGDFDIDAPTPAHSAPGHSAPARNGDWSIGSKRGEDETDEMDAVAGADKGSSSKNDIAGS